MWYTNNITIVGPPTNVDPKYLTMRVVPGSKEDIYFDHPWRAPGSAALASPCGQNGNNHHAENGIDGRSLPLLNRTQWVAGSTAEVAFALTANHGGGYQYRLCPADQEQTEACFQTTPLEFASNMTWVQMADKVSTRVEVSSLRLSKGTIPAGATWARNPIPNEPDWPEWPAPGGKYWGHQNIPFNIVDLIKVPAHLQEGAYTLSWRWDSEQTKQVWANCGDVEVVPAAFSTMRKEQKERSEQKERLPQGSVVWKWSEGTAGISGGAVLAGKGVVFGSFLSTGSASPGTNRTFWSLDRTTGKTRWSVEVPTAVLYPSITGDFFNGDPDVIYFGTLGPWVFAVSADTGAVRWRSGGGVPANYDGIPGDDYFSAPVLLGKYLFIGNYDNYFYALDTTTGAIRWRRNMGGPCNGSPVASLKTELVIFTVRPDFLVALDANTGELIWKVATTCMLSSPTIYNDIVFVGTLNGTAIAYDLITGRHLWTVGSGYGFGAVWALSAVPVSKEGIAYLGSDDGKMYAIDLERNGTIVWTFQTEAPIESAATLKGDGPDAVLYFGSLDGSLYAVNSWSGTGLWSYKTGMYIICVPAVDDNGVVYVGSYDQSFYALRGPA